MSGADLRINNHIHTPYSFSAFSSVEEAVEKASEEGINVLGINDFYVTDGYPDFARHCLKKGIFPLFNVEMIGVNSGDQAAGIRSNDPNNPGRIYISGKGLSLDPLLPGSGRSKLERVVAESNRQVAGMVRLLNQWLAKHHAGIELTVEEIMDRLAENLLRERHVAKMLRIRIGEMVESDGEYRALLTAIYGGQAPKASPGDIAGTENELRARLLKAGAPAFVPEDEQAFLPAEEIITILADSGGIPTYPMLLDGAGERFTEYEAHKEQLLERLQEMGFRSVEMIPLRNKRTVLEEYARYFYNHGFMVTFGTEHNTSSGGSLKVRCLSGEPPGEELEEIAFRGAASIAAHQYLVAKEGPDHGNSRRDELEILGKAVLSYYFNTFTKHTPK